MFVRQMLVSDIDQVYEVACQSLDETYVKEVFFFFINGWPAGQLVVVSGTGELVGFLSGVKLTPDKATIMLLGVSPRYRRAGVGSRMMDEFRIRTMMEGMHYIQLEVKDSNFPATEFYKKMGFAAVEYLENFYNDGGNAVRMICRVRGNA
ncbi:MAG: GNAT family N-acetyltransferase [Candidatus Methanoplasma sp.]|jgi:ribosomal-protein-alanine N-acetyltransferase|nr:GNAT family N-acetyltransferase [Candidatus Methanoplasma sp.]